MRGNRRLEATSRSSQRFRILARGATRHRPVILAGDVDREPCATRRDSRFPGPDGKSSCCLSRPPSKGAARRS